MRVERRKAAILAAVALTAAVIYLRAVLAGARKVPRFVYVGQPLAQADYAALGTKLGWRRRSLDAGGGIVLRGLERPASDPASPWILFFEGNSANSLADAQRFLDALLDGNDWGAATWAYRGYDGSGGKPDPTVLMSDGWQEYQRLLIEEAIDCSHVHLVGFSLGTSVVAAIAARAGPRAPASVTLLAPMTELDMVTGRLSRAHRYETLKYLDAIEGPVLILHGGRDTTLAVEGGRLLAGRLGARAGYVERPELGHLDLREAPEVLNAVRTFIASHAISAQSRP
jgi:pimeloyl-ACP methyl ester carboxylesterase